jgi:hypothetical protein
MNESTAVAQVGAAIGPGDRMSMPSAVASSPSMAFVIAIRGCRCSPTTAPQSKSSAARRGSHAQAGRVLRAHRLIGKVPGIHRYHLSAHGRIIVAALIASYQLR